MGDHSYVNSYFLCTKAPRAEIHFLLMLLESRIPSAESVDAVLVFSTGNHIEHSGPLFRGGLMGAKLGRGLNSGLGEI